MSLRLWFCATRHDPDTLQTKTQYANNPVLQQPCEVVETPTLFILWKKLLLKMSFYCVQGKERETPASLDSKPHMLEAWCWRLCWVCPVQHPPPGLIQHLLPGSATDWLLEEEKGRQMLLLRFQSFRSHSLHKIQIPQVFLNLSQDGQITTGDRTSLWAET